ncbi:hypothetical protein GCM10028778_21690 [Barrientosiimonas marina]|uniref:DUF4190 domain-containing protein n=1 Tax=Lentibacillus kimchii TaxID=1542911 RepID=A0ABW2USP9_9BACI
MANTEVATPRFNYAGISLALGIVGIFIPVLGLVFGVAGTVTSNKTIKALKNANEKGYKTAVAGLVCSIAAIVIQIFAIIGLWTFYQI